MGRRGDVVGIGDGAWRGGGGDNRCGVEGREWE